MDSIKINGVTIQFTTMPYRKQDCFIISDDKAGRIMGYVKAEDLPEVKRMWQKILDGIK